VLQACCEQIGVAVKHYNFIRELFGANLCPITAYVLWRLYCVSPKITAQQYLVTGQTAFFQAVTHVTNK
jgi:hypothetical protein